jgi:peptidoglycan/xylan/chitin deacetylase (PgdA/CDA1 family)
MRGFRSRKAAGRSTLLLCTGAWLASLFLYQPAWLIASLQRADRGILWSVPAATRGVAITFDDGPDPAYTPRVLDMLKAHGAKATFFLTGTNAAANPDLVMRIHGEGHLAGNHLLRDEYVLLDSAAEIEQALVETEKRAGITGPPKYVRPPRLLFGSAFRLATAKHGYTIVLGSAYVSDPYGPPAGYISWAMRRMLRPGAILVLHDAGGNRENTLAALPSILEHGRTAGLAFVTLADLEREARSGRSNR